MGSQASSEVLQDNAVDSDRSWTYWKSFVDLVSMIWCGAFIITFIDIFDNFIILNVELLYFADIIMIFTLPIFIIDLLIKYFRYDKSSLFIKKHWIDIVYVIPYFRVLRILRIFRLIGLVRVSIIFKLSKVIINFPKAVRKIVKFVKRSKFLS